MLNSTNDLELSVDCYATFEDILAHVPHIRLSNMTVDTDEAGTWLYLTRPTRAQACGIARDVYREVNSLLDGLGYVIPIASGNSTAIGVIGRMCAVGTARSIEAAAASVDGRSTDTADFLRREYERMWKALTSGDITLPAATKTGSAMVDRNKVKPAYGFDRNGSGNEQAPVFSKGMEW